MDEFDKRTSIILARIDELAAISEDEGMLTRTFGSTAFVNAGKKVLSWMEQAGLQARIDNIGNIRGRLLSSATNTKTFIIGSHIDTVVNAGKFDGPLGVIMGLDIVEHLVKSETKVPFNIELIAFSDEEGVRFHSTFLGSTVIAGTFDKKLLDKKDATGVSLKELITLMGEDPGKLDEDSMAAKDVVGYFEIHIEQGPVLYKNRVPVAIVKSIAGQRRVELRFKGMAGHAGTVPMKMRQDALCAAAECIIKIEALATSNKEGIVATVGKLDIINAASNVIPGEVICSLDVRCDDDIMLQNVYESLVQACTESCNKRIVDFSSQLIQFTKPVACNTHMNQLLREAISGTGYETIDLVSGAGHDAVAISQIAPVAMLFVRCFEGISHNPLENAEKKDVKAALKIAEKFIDKLISTYNPI